jgi:hypothetical protein
MPAGGLLVGGMNRFTAGGNTIEFIKNQSQLQARPLRFRRRQSATTKLVVADL